LTKGYQLGQIQVLLGMLVAGGLYAYLCGKRGLAGVLIGLCCLVKPQYAIVLLWGVVRRDWRFSAHLAGVGAVALVAAVAQFGLDNHLRYLDVLREMSRFGEAYWPNQSVNGLLHRFLGNGNPQVFRIDSFAPYHPLIYYATLVTSAAIVAIALW